MKNRARAFIAYIITNLINGKQYVGITTRLMELRWRQHKSMKLFAIGEAIRKYGVAAFEIEHVASARSEQELRDLERVLIAQYDTISPNGYNLCAGGLGVLTPSAESNEKKRAALLGRKWTDKQKARHVIALTGRKMPPRTAEHSANLSASLKGFKFPPMTAQHRANIAAAHIGKKRPPGTGEKIAASKLGKPRTEEAKAAMRAGWARRKAELADKEMQS